MNYWDTELKDLGTIPFAPHHVGYQHPTLLCITRNEMFYPGQTISHEQIGIDVENWFGDLQVYIHLTGQLMTVIESDSKFMIKV